MRTDWAKRLDLNKDMVLEAQVQQRRNERLLSTAIRAGQDAGEIRGSGQTAASSHGLSSRIQSRHARECVADTPKTPCLRGDFGAAQGRVRAPSIIPWWMSGGVYPQCPAMPGAGYVR